VNPGFRTSSPGASPAGPRIRYPFDRRAANARKRASRRLRDPMAGVPKEAALLMSSGNTTGHVGVNGEQLRRRKQTHLFGDDPAPIAALGHEFCVPRHETTCRATDTSRNSKARGRFRVWTTDSSPARTHHYASVAAPCGGLNAPAAVDRLDPAIPRA
jgi:hypothetical protein